MKKLLIALLLVSPFSSADWGDVYYCQMTNQSKIALDGKRTDYILDKFTFKLDKTKNAMVLGKGGLFDRMELELREGMSFPSKEAWFAKDTYSMALFRDSTFLYSMVASEALYSISADCEKS